MNVHTSFIHHSARQKPPKCLSTVEGINCSISHRKRNKLLLHSVLVTQSCLFLYDPTDCSPPGTSVHGTFQPRIPEWVAISFSRGSSRPRDRTCVSCIAGRFLSSGKEGTSHKIILACFRGSPGSPLHLPCLTSLRLEILSLPRCQFWGSTSRTPSVTCMT